MMMKSLRFLLAFLTCMLIVVAALPYAEAHSGVSLSGYGTATVDGSIGAGEWAAAGKVNFGPFGPGPYTGTLYMMNDGTDLHMAVSISGDPDYGGAGDFDNFVSVFDNDHDAVHELGDDCLGAGTPFAGAFVDWFYDIPGFLWVPDTPAGTPDGQGAGSQFAPNLNHFELKHPLDSADDAHDFSLSVGQTVGFALELMVDGVYYPLWAYGLGEEGNPTTYANYVVASPPPTPTPTPAPVGGVLISVNKLDLLAPYLALICLVGAVTTVFAVRRRRKA